jgi:hypothetical protein
MDTLQALPLLISTYDLQILHVYQVFCLAYVAANSYKALQCSAEFLFDICCHLANTLGTL